MSASDKYKDFEKALDHLTVVLLERLFRKPGNRFEKILQTAEANAMKQLRKRKGTRTA